MGWAIVRRNVVYKCLPVRYVQEARFIRHERDHNYIRVQTGGTYAPGHFLGGEIENGVYVAQGYFTHGKGFGFKISDKDIVTSPGTTTPKPGYQHFVPFNTPISIPLHMLHPTALGSQMLLQDTATLKAIMDAINTTLNNQFQIIK